MSVLSSIFRHWISNNEHHQTRMGFLQVDALSSTNNLQEDDLAVPTYLRYKGSVSQTRIHKTINLNESTDSNLHTISVPNQLAEMGRGEVRKVEAKLSDACVMNIREFSGSNVHTDNGFSYVTSAGASCSISIANWPNRPAIFRKIGNMYTKS